MSSYTNLSVQEKRRARRIGRIVGKWMESVNCIRGWGEHPWWATRPARLFHLRSEALRTANSVAEQLELDRIVEREIRAAVRK